MSTPRPPVRVAVGVLRNRAGELLVARRPEGKPLAGYWEFPGGKCEPDEPPSQALGRELAEELGVTVRALRPLIEIPWSYPDFTVRLLVFDVLEFEGRPRGIEGQALAWRSLEALRDEKLPPANRGILTALGLPERLLVTPDVAGTGLGAERRWFRALESSLARLCTPGDGTSAPVAGAAPAPLVQLRLGPDCSEATWRAALRVIRAHGARGIVNASPELALALGADGVHLNRARLRTWAAAGQRPLPELLLVSAVAHDIQELIMARTVRADLALVSPVAPTASHPGAATLGWSGFAALADQAPMPVYALGGMGEADLPLARAHGGQGIAAISALWHWPPRISATPDGPSPHNDRSTTP